MLHKPLKILESIQAEPFLLEMISQPQNNSNNRKGRAYRLSKEKRKDKANKDNKESILTICLHKMHKTKIIQWLTNLKTLRLFTITEVLSRCSTTVNLNNWLIRKKCNQSRLKLLQIAQLSFHLNNNLSSDTKSSNLTC